MPSPAEKITKRAVDAAKPGNARAFIWDSELRGFGLRIEPTGTKTFILRFRPKGTGREGPKRFVVIGRYGDLTVDQARSDAKALLGQVARGEDPTSAREQARGAISFIDLANRYLDEHVATKKKPATLALYRHHLIGLAAPEFGSRKAQALTHSDILKLHGKIGAKHPATANRVVVTVSGLFTFAAKIGEVPPGFNPARGIEPFREKGRERYLSNDELSRLGEVLRRAETIGLPFEVNEAGTKAKHAPKPENRLRQVDPFAIAAIRLLLLTGARLREILHARWSYLDADRGLLVLPDSKTGAKPIYLSAPAMAVLNEIPRQHGNPFIFPGEGRLMKDGAVRSPAPRTDLQRPWAAICKAADLSGLRLHDLRHTFAATGAGNAMGLPIIGKLLGHTQVSTTQRYAHLDADPLHRAANAIGNALSDAMAVRK